MFERPHHRLIADVLGAFDGALLRESHCLFGGGTAIALSYGEYRESVDIDFLVSDVASYRKLRERLTSPQGIQALVRAGHPPLMPAREIRADQYGIRTMLAVAGAPIKFEIVLEGRIALEPAVGPGICGVSTLTRHDMMTTKLLANSDRWRDDGVFSRDLIDLAMMGPTRKQLNLSLEKASTAYGAAVRDDLRKAITLLKERQAWLERCMQVMAMTLPKAVVWQKIRHLERALT